MKNSKGFTLIELLIVVAIIGIIAVIAIPSLLNALDRARQMTTLANMRKLGEGVEIYIMDFNTVGAPKAATITDLKDIMILTEINENEGIIEDAWGQEMSYEFEAAAGGRKYTVLAFGSDGQLGPAPAVAGETKKFTEDLIWANGIFTQQPEGRQTSK